MKKKSWLIIAFIFAFVGVLVIHNVPKQVSAEDQSYLASIFNVESADASQLSFEGQIEFIHSSITNLHKNISLGTPIPHGNLREPKQLKESQSGLCYDFSRSIEKHLNNNGFETRHVAIYVNSGNWLVSLFKPGVFSHSLCEVKTKKGWMIVDSNVAFYALDKDQNVYSYKQLSALEELPNWEVPLPEGFDQFYNQHLVVVYGLYSRHGKFYPPYTPIPDYNLRELLYNF